MNYQDKSEFLTSPFAIGDESRTTIADTNDALSQSHGIGVVHTLPSQSGTPRMTRHEMNEIGCMATCGKWWEQMGYGATFEPTVSAAIGGYPKGTILKYYEHLPITSTLGTSSVTDDFIIEREVISLQDDNQKNFVRSSTNASPYLIGSLEDGVVWWRFVTSNQGFSYFPDLSEIVDYGYTEDQLTEAYENFSIYPIASSVPMGVSLNVGGFQGMKYLNGLGNTTSTINYGSYRVPVVVDGTARNITQSTYLSIGRSSEWPMQTMPRFVFPVNLLFLYCEEWSTSDSYGRTATLSKVATK